MNFRMVDGDATRNARRFARQLPYAASIILHNSIVLFPRQSHPCRMGEQPINGLAGFQYPRL